MTQSRFNGRGKGQVHNCARRDGRGSAWRNDRGSGYSSKPKTTKVGLLKELEGKVFDYGGHRAAYTMGVTQEKIQQYIGIKYSEDIGNELKNKVQVVIKPPEYSKAIEKSHVEYQALVRSKQTKLLMAGQAKLSKLWLIPAVAGR